MDKKAQINLWYVLVAVMMIMGLQYWLGSQAVQTVPYSEFQALLKDGKIADITIVRRQRSIDQVA